MRMADVTIKKINAKEKSEMGIAQWPVWNCGIRSFPWQYTESETCFIIEGDVVVGTAAGDYHIQAGDLVTFAAGLRCTWNVTKPVKKHYSFG